MDNIQVLFLGKLIQTYGGTSFYDHLFSTVTLAPSQIISLSEKSRMLVPIVRSPVYQGHWPGPLGTVIMRFDSIPIFN